MQFPVFPDHFQPGQGKSCGSDGTCVSGGRKGSLFPRSQDNALFWWGEEARRPGALLDEAECTRLQAGEALGRSGRPFDYQAGDSGGFTDAEVNPVAGLGEEALPAAQGAPLCAG